MVEVYNKITYTNPFPGLRSFEQEDAYLFFGRTSQLRNLKEKLAYSRFLAIIGSSGSGKSSLVKAGLIPELVSGNLKASTDDPWQVVFFNPEATPIRNLAQSLHQTFSRQNHAFAERFSPQEVERWLRTDSVALLDWCKQTNVLLVIDQFEELFRYHQADEDQGEVMQFINLILTLSHHASSSVYVVLTMRSDYLDECTDYEGLTEAINNGYYLLPKMTRDEVREAIVTPVQVMGATISEELIDRLLSDIGEKVDQLPILQHALMRTWNYWQLKRTSGNQIEVSDYEAIGTMQKAITVHAEEVYENLPDERSRLVTEKIFKSLIVLNAGNTGLVQPLSVRAMENVTGLDSGLLCNVLNRFREPEVAFLTPSTTVNTEDGLIIDLSHERLIHLWDRLHTWVKEEVDSAKFYRQVSNSATLYHEGRTGLWVNPELQIGLKWLTENRPTPGWANRYDPYLERVINFLEYSRDQYDFAVRSKEERQKRELRRARFFAIFLGIGSLVSLFFLIVSAVLRAQARQSEEAAIAEKKIALFERNRAEEQTREAITQKKIAEQQELMAEQQRHLTEEQRVIAVRGQQTIELKRQEAEAARQMAVAQKQQADGARREAEQQRNRAELSQKDAETQRSVAVRSQQYAEQQRGKAVARTLSLQALQMAENSEDDLPALLALEAYQLNLRNGGLPDNPDIFNALSKAANTRTVLRRHTDVVRALAVQPGASRNVIASGSDDGTIKLWSYDTPDQAPQSLAAPRQNLNGIRSVAFSPDGKTVWGGNEKGMLYRWEISRAQNAPLAVKAHTGPMLSLLNTNDGSRLISISTDGQLRSWQFVDNRLDSLQNTKTALPIYCARLSPDGKQLLCGSSNGRLLRFDPQNLAAKPVILTRRELGDRVTALAFSTNGQQLVTGTSTGLLYAWEMTGGNLAQNGSLLSGRHSSTVNDLVFSPDGKLMASCSADWTIQIRDAGNLIHQQQPIVIQDFDSWVMAVRFSGDGKRLVAAGADRTVRIRNVNPADLYNELLKKVKRNLTVDEWNKYIGKDITYEKVKPD
ncbi:WD40 repeat protein [Larkinella arboricola]|uniref:WD40 repeat protein n=1 Tax=Larkinella arboricola TaxID=643671 RepID=A0A327WPM0_LARAB|nr:NACHT domain-containing protein [Larkinella arboricola]RAJ93168.1 WD40 repeat protein [Larkinella arboricola]